MCSGFYQWYQWYTNIVQGSTNGTIGNTIGTNGNANGTIGSPNGTIGKPMVPLVTNGTTGKIINGTVPVGEPRTEPVLVIHVHVIKNPFCVHANNNNADQSVH